jgi:hypothetical protein
VRLGIVDAALDDRECTALGGHLNICAHGMEADEFVHLGCKSQSQASRNDAGGNIMSQNPSHPNQDGGRAWRLCCGQLGRTGWRPHIIQERLKYGVAFSIAQFTLLWGAIERWLMDLGSSS